MSGCHATPCSSSSLRMPTGCNPHAALRCDWWRAGSRDSVGEHAGVGAVRTTVSSHAGHARQHRQRGAKQAVLHSWPSAVLWARGFAIGWMS